MMTRYLSSAGAGIAVTMALFYVMHALIAMAEPVVTEPRVAFQPDWRYEPREPDPVIDDRDLELDREDLVPPDLPRTPDLGGTDTVTVHVPHAPSVPTFTGVELEDLAYSDGPLVSIINVQPVYPAAAIRRGLEGYATVQFDVTAMGTVTNAVVVDSSHPAFDKAARDAAYRFRYKPQVVDGVPQPSYGVQVRFVFELPH